MVAGIVVAAGAITFLIKGKKTSKLKSETTISESSGGIPDISDIKLDDISKDKVVEESLKAGAVASVIKEVSHKPHLVNPSLSDRTIMICSEENECIEKFTKLCKLATFLEVISCTKDEIESELTSNTIDLVLVSVLNQEEFDTMEDKLNNWKEKNDTQYGLLIDDSIYENNLTILKQLKE